MALTYIFANQTQPNLAWLDVNFSEVGLLGTLPCTVAGIDTLALTQVINTSTVSVYSNYLRLSCVIIQDNFGPVTVQLGALAVLPVYKDTVAGPVLLTGGELQANNLAVFTYDAALNSGAGGFHVAAPSSGGGTGTVTEIDTINGLTGGPITGSGTVGLAQIANLRLLANISGVSAVPTPNTLTGILDQILGATVGGVPVRGASWLSATPGANALPLQSVPGGGGAAYGGVISAVSAGTGSVQGDAAAIGNCNLAAITTVGAGTGIILPATTGLPLIQVINRGGANLKVYPQSGSQIETLGANAADTVVATTGNAWYQAVSATQWYRTVAS